MDREIILNPLTILLRYASISMWITQHLLCRRKKTREKIIPSVHTKGSATIAAVTNGGSQLTFGTGTTYRIFKYMTVDGTTYTMLGLDLHADISCAGKDAHIVAQCDGRTCTVYPFNDSYEAMENVNIVNVLYKYENTDGDQYILEVNQCLKFSDTMIHSLLCTNQVRHHVVIVNDVPKACDQNSPQDIRVDDRKYIIPLEMNGPIPYLPISKPTLEDI